MRQKGAWCVLGTQSRNKAERDTRSKRGRNAQITEFGGHGKYFGFYLKCSSKLFIVLNKGITPVQSFNKFIYHLLCAIHCCETGGTAVHNFTVLCPHGTTIPVEGKVTQSVNK